MLLSALSTEHSNKEENYYGNDNDTKILAAHAGLDQVKAGQLIDAKLDMVLANDITAPVAINEFEKAGFTEVFDKIKDISCNGPFHT